MSSGRADRDLAAMRAADNGWVDRLIDGIATTPDRRPLTPAETQALVHASHGLETRESAVTCGRSYESVKKSLQVARRKLAAKNTAHAVALALRGKLIT